MNGLRLTNLYQASVRAEKIARHCEFIARLGVRLTQLLCSHFVNDNDTCSSIQTQYGLNSTILTQNNPNVDDGCDNLYPGLALCVAQTVIAPPIPAGFFNSTGTGSVQWVPVSPGDDGYDDDLPLCDDVE
jgi:hypothetical protein